MLLGHNRGGGDLETNCDISDIEHHNPNPYCK
jgi:hypothetical protein